MLRGRFDLACYPPVTDLAAMIAAEVHPIPTRPNIATIELAADIPVSAIARAGAGHPAGDDRGRRGKIGGESRHRGADGPEET
jgi:hypothetical protein